MSKIIVKFAVVGLLAVTIVASCYQYLKQPNRKDFFIKLLDKDIACKDAKVVNIEWRLPASEVGGYAYVSNNNDVYIYDIRNNSSVKTPNKTLSYGGGASGLGEDKLIVSPDTKYSAFIDESSQNVKIMSNKTGETSAIPNSKDVTYLTAWTGNSKMLIYYLKGDTIRTKNEGMGGIGAYKNPVTFIKNQNIPGFHIFNIEDGVDAVLYPIENVITTASKKILTRGTDYTKDRIYIFDPDNFNLDLNIIKDNFDDYATGQFTVDNNGVYWAFTNSNHPSGNDPDAEIIYAKFPEKNGKIIASGRWAQVQQPLISPNGKLVAYIQRNTDPNGKYDVYLFDSNKEERRVIANDAYTRQWINDHLIVVEHYRNSANIYGQTSSIELIDLATSQTTIIKDFD